MNTESRRAAAAKYADKRIADGWAKITVWLSPEALKQVAVLTAMHGSRDAGLNAALTCEPQQPHRPPEKTAAQPPKPSPATTPAPKVAKVAQGRSGGVGGGEKFRGVTATGGEVLPVRQAQPKGAK